MRKFVLTFVGVVWCVMVLKTILVSGAQESSFITPFFGAMLDPSWQAHFNLDLLAHSLLLSCWFFWRERSIALGFIFSLCAIGFGALFSFAYLWLAVWKNGENPHHWFRAK